MNMNFPQRECLVTEDSSVVMDYFGVFLPVLQCGIFGITFTFSHFICDGQIKWSVEISFLIMAV